MTPSAQKTGQQGDDERALWAIVRQRMSDKEWSNIELGRRAGISHQSIGRYLAGERSAKMTDAFAVLRALGLDPVEATRLAEQHSRTLREADIHLTPAASQATGNLVVGDESTATSLEQAFDTSGGKSS